MKEILRIFIKNISNPKVNSIIVICLIVLIQMLSYLNVDFGFNWIILLFVLLLIRFIYYIYSVRKSFKEMKISLLFNLIVLVLLLALLKGRIIDFGTFNFLFIIHLMANLLVSILLFIQKDNEQAKRYLLSFALVLLVGFSSCSAIMLIR